MLNGDGNENGKNINIKTKNKTALHVQQRNYSIVNTRFYVYCSLLEDL